MAFVPADLAAVDAAIASGELTVTSEGRSVTYRSMRELLQARGIIAADLQTQQQACARTGPRHLLASFAD